MTDPRAAVVMTALANHARHDRINPARVTCTYPRCTFEGRFPSDFNTHRTEAVLAALDSYASTHPFGGRIPPSDPEWGNKGLGRPELTNGRQ